MQVSVPALLTFEIENPPKGPHGKVIVERHLIEMVSGKAIDQTKPIQIVSDLGVHPVSLVEIFAHDSRPKLTGLQYVNEAPRSSGFARGDKKTSPVDY